MSFSSTNVVEAREFWDRKVKFYIQRYEYGADSCSKFINNLVRMGYKRKVVEDILRREKNGG